MESSDPKNIAKNVDQPLVFLPAVEDVSVGAVTGAVCGGMLVLMFGGILGRAGEKFSPSIGLSGTLGGCLVVWSVFLLLPLLMMLNRRQWLLAVIVLLAGVAYLWGLHAWIAHKDIGILYPWVLSALPFGICLGTVYLPIRFAKEEQRRRDLVCVSLYEYLFAKKEERRRDFVYVLWQEYLFSKALLWATRISGINRHRRGSVLAGVVSGGLGALLIGTFVAWRGDEAVAQVFGSAWNIAYTTTALGTLAGGCAGSFAWSIREKQEKCLQELAQQSGGNPAQAMRV